MQKIQDSPGSHLTSDITDTGGGYGIAVCPGAKRRRKISFYL